MGAVAAGGSTSPANPNYTPKELAYQLEMTKAKVLIAHPSNLPNALAAAKLVGLDKSNVFLFGTKTVDGVLPYTQVFLNKRRAQPAKLTPEQARDTVAYLCFSSGTTGKSKGVMTTHTNIISNVLQYYAMDHPFVNGQKDRMIGVLPFFHIFGLTVLLHVALYLGVPVYVMSRFELTQFCETVQNSKITFTCLVPPIILLLAKHPIVDQYDLSSLRQVICGAAPLSAELQALVNLRLPKMIVKQGYGLTETSPVAVLEPSDRVIPGSIGILVPNMTAKIVNEEGQEVKQGERGELWLKGPNVMKGYINNPEATADCIDQEGYFHTGDVAVQDEKGHFYIVDRIKELIKYKGFQVPPAELEAVLLGSPLVDDCAVIGVYDHEQATELPRGYIVLKSGVPATKETEEVIKKFVADHVVYYKQLRSVVFVQEIPKSPAGKILRRILRDAAAQEQNNKAKL
ncbi:putative 4-coumarate--CoA ligase 1 [Choanephora cucurbitarum]|uniref:Putative 4-coumarate--CoA ligase 1 n=1 Tax=Choanephora cucurbitarum TaxID=101091 RepID=A0A1C7NS72_9FUNG|nr:putative 4-coumarate--CoA ligase 1 [Choanephora cucurbitarum]